MVRGALFWLIFILSLKGYFTINAMHFAANTLERPNERRKVHPNAIEHQAANLAGQFHLNISLTNAALELTTNRSNNTNSRTSTP